jgi:hypothetical protein
MGHPKYVIRLDEKSLRALCRRRGSDSYTEMGEVLGLSRTTVMRACRGGRVGPGLLGALFETFSVAEIVTIIKGEALDDGSE